MEQKEKVTKADQEGLVRINTVSSKTAQGWNLREGHGQRWQIQAGVRDHEEVKFRHSLLMFLPISEDWTEVTRRHWMLHSHCEEKEEKDVLEQCVPAHRYIVLVPTSAQQFTWVLPHKSLFFKFYLFYFFPHKSLVSTFFPKLSTTSVFQLQKYFLCSSCLWINHTLFVFCNHSWVSIITQ